MFHDASTHKMPFLVAEDCLPGRRCQAVCLLCSIKVYNKQVQDPVFQQVWSISYSIPVTLGCVTPMLQGSNTQRW